MATFSQSQPSQAAASSLCVEAQIQNARIFQQFLKSINFKDDVSVVLNQDGLKLTVEDSKTFQANAFIQREVFRIFKISHEDQNVFFQMDLPSLIDCLGMFGQSSSSSAASAAASVGPVLHLKYSQDDDPLRLWMEEAGVVVEINARTRDAANLVDFGFSSTDISCKVILQADKFKEVLADLDLTSEFVDVSVDPDAAIFKVSTDGECGKLDIEIPKASEMVSHFNSSKLVSARYTLSLFKHALKPMAIAEKVSVRVNALDVLCLQYMVKFEDHKCFLEFLCVPEEKETEE